VAVVVRTFDLQGAEFSASLRIVYFSTPKI
jgi:hypothetical protein